MHPFEKFNGNNDVVFYVEENVGSDVWNDVRSEVHMRRRLKIIQKLG